jgi:hypothetical protein
MTQALNQFTDAGPLLEGCDMEHCTHLVGGDHAPTCRRCWVCRRVLGEHDHDWINTSAPDGSVRGICDPCWEKADDWLEEGLDYTEDDFNIEGQPEFNGAFGQGGRR